MVGFKPLLEFSLDSVGCFTKKLTGCEMLVSVDIV